MLGALLLISSLVARCDLPPAAVSDSLERLYKSGKTWQQFLDAVKARRESWKGNYEIGAPAPVMVERVKAVAGRWRLLAVAEDWCGDSANTIPYLVRLVEAVSNLEIRIVNSNDGRWVMEHHKTPDGRAATPTVVLLDERSGDLGCFVERPLQLRRWAEELKPKLSEDDYQKQKMAWYRDDRGRETVREIVELLEAAASGNPTCAR